MSSANLPDIATFIWGAVASGSLERIGAYGTESTVEAVKSLWQRLKDSRAEKGLPETPASREELYEGLVALLIEDPETAPLVRRIELTAHADQVVHNVFDGTVTMHGGTIGINNGPR
ncbi:hypothetical protein ACWENQ_25260 [Nonomuraea sp. NPDC004354]